MKNAWRIVLAVALAASFFPGAAFAEAVNDERGAAAAPAAVLAGQEPAAEGLAEGAAEDFATEALAAEGEDAAAQGPNAADPTKLLENSWRYVDGVPVAPEEDILPLSDSPFVPWSWNGQAFVNSFGDPIEGATRKGIDVSEHQGYIDWAAVKADGVTFAIIRCGYGNDSRYQDDKWFVRNVEGALAQGIDIGVYLYSYAYNTAMARSEANHTLRLLREAGLTPSDLAYPVYYDLEHQAGTNGPCGEANGEKVPISNDMLAEMAKVYCGAMENAGYEAGVYANLNWWKNFLTNKVFDTWERWVAQYNYRCDYAGSYRLWQCTSSGAVAGVNGRVDVNFDFQPVYPQDVNPDDWYVKSGAFDYVMKNDLMGGYDNGLFGPYDNVTRGQVATVLWRMAGEPIRRAPAFEDVDYRKYYGDAINWARATGVIGGHVDPDGVRRNFKPDDLATREELAVMFENYAKKIGHQNTYSNQIALSKIPGSKNVSSWAANSMGWAVDKGLISGIEENGTVQLKPRDNAWRASMASMITVLHRDVL